MKIPRLIRADVERAFLHAYYRHVCGCHSVLLEDDSSHWVVWAARADRLWMMDFTSQYEFPEEMCFMPPSERLQGALATVLSTGAQVDLAEPEAVARRLRRTVLAVPEDSDEQAFVWAAGLIRRAAIPASGEET